MRQPLRQLAVLLLQLAHFFEEGIVLGFGAAPMGSQPPVALLAPVSKVRGVETLAAEQGSDGSRFRGRTRLDQNTPLIVGRELAALRLGEHLGVGPRFGFAWPCAAFGLPSLGLTPPPARRNQNAGGGYPNTCPRLHECFLLRPLH